MDDWWWPDPDVYKLIDDLTPSGLVPARGLAVALIEDAFDCFVVGLTSEDAAETLQYRSDERWFFSDDIEYPLSFVNVCESLGVSVDGVRCRLRSLERAVLTGEPTEVRRGASARRVNRGPQRPAPDSGSRSGTKRGGGKGGRKQAGAR